MTDLQRLFLLLALLAGYFLIRLLGPVLTPFMLAGILAYMCDPLVDRLERWRFRRSLATAVVLTAGSLLLLAGPLILLPIVYAKIVTFSGNLPAYLAWLNEVAFPWLQAKLLPLAGDSDWPTILRDHFTQHLGGMTGFLQALLGRLMQSGKVITVFVANLLLTFVVFGYLLQDWDRIRELVLALVPRRHEATVRGLGTEVNRALGAFLRGQLIIMAYVAVALATGLLIVGVELALPIGLLAGTITFIPWVGSAVGATVTVIATLLQFRDLLHPALALGVFVLVQQVGDNFISPRIMGQRIGVHPVAIVFAVLAGGRLFGLFGLVLAVPAAAVLNVVGVHAVQRYRASRLYLDTPAHRRAGRGRRRVRRGPHA
ncbi:MAG: AI-2E family transporter [Candidatus Krumholzibacteriia bacterium]